MLYQSAQKIDYLETAEIKDLEHDLALLINIIYRLCNYNSDFQKNDCDKHLVQPFLYYASHLIIELAQRKQLPTVDQFQDLQRFPYPNCKNEETEKRALFFLNFLRWLIEKEFKFCDEKILTNGTAIRTLNQYAKVNQIQFKAIYQSQSFIRLPTHEQEQQSINKISEQVVTDPKIISTANKLGIQNSEDLSYAKFDQTISVQINSTTTQIECNKKTVADLEKKFRDVVNSHENLLEDVPPSSAIAITQRLEVAGHSKTAPQTETQTTPMNNLMGRLTYKKDMLEQTQTKANLLLSNLPKMTYWDEVAANPTTNFQKFCNFFMPPDFIEKAKTKEQTIIKARSDVNEIETDLKKINNTLQIGHTYHQQQITLRSLETHIVSLHELQNDLIHNQISAGVKSDGRQYQENNIYQDTDTEEFFSVEEFSSEEEQTFFHMDPF